MNEARELVTQGNILGDKISTILEDGGDNREDQRKLDGIWRMITSAPAGEKSQRIRGEMG